MTTTQLAHGKARELASKDASEFLLRASEITDTLTGRECELVLEWIIGYVAAGEDNEKFAVAYGLHLELIRHERKAQSTTNA